MQASDPNTPRTVRQRRVAISGSPTSSFSTSSSIDAAPGTESQPAASDTWIRIAVGLGLVTLALLYLLGNLFAFEPASWVSGAPELCWIQRNTGIECPGCGMGEACLWWSSGEPQRALEAHPFSPMLIVASVAWLGLGVARRRGWLASRPVDWSPHGWALRVWFVVFVTVLVWWWCQRIQPLLG